MKLGDGMALDVASPRMPSFESALNRDKDQDRAVGRKCQGSLHPGRRGTFGMVVCPVCGARLKPMPGHRLPNHKIASAHRNRDRT